MPNAPQTAAAPDRLAELYAQCRPRMERTAYAVLGNRQDAEDAVQNAFCQLLRHADRLDAVPESEQPFWITAIVRNEARALLRRRRDTVPLEERDGTEREAGEDAAYAELVSLIRALPASYRETMEKKLLEKRTDAEIAESLGISKTAVSTRVHRGRVLLRRLLHTALTAALAVLLSLGVLLAVSPAARAAAARLVTELYEEYIVYRYIQPPRLDALPDYAITAPPAGYAEARRFSGDAHAGVFYTSEAGGFLCLEYFLMEENNVAFFSMYGRTSSPVTVGGLPGQFWESEDASSYNLLAWIDEEQGVRFAIVGMWSEEEMLHMAESVSTVEPPE